MINIRWLGKNKLYLLCIVCIVFFATLNISSVPESLSFASEFIPNGIEDLKNNTDNYTFSNSGNSSNSTVFVRHEHVVIATKIHGIIQWGLLVQSMCLLHYAYNHKVLYDIIAFSTNPVPEEKIKSLQAMLSPARFRLVVDNRGLHEEIAALPQDHQPDVVFQLSR